MAKCMYTGKAPRTGNNRPKSLKATSRWYQPNVQKVGGVKMSTTFRRTLKKYGLIQSGRSMKEQLRELGLA